MCACVCPCHRHVPLHDVGEFYFDVGKWMGEWHIMWTNGIFIPPQVGEFILFAQLVLGHGELVCSWKIDV